MEAYDIYDATHVFNDCEDRRPWLLIEYRYPNWMCFPFASQDYRDEGFEVSMDHPNFTDTGLRKDCHILDARFFELTLEEFDRRRGMLTGALLQEFRTHAGI